MATSVISSAVGNRRAQISWCLYDWANSAFPTIIVTFVFATYFTGSVAVSEIEGTVQWGYAVSLSALAIALLSPIIGAISDHAGPRKPWLALFSAVAICAAGLARWAPKGLPGTLAGQQSFWPVTKSVGFPALSYQWTQASWPRHRWPCCITCSRQKTPGQIYAAF